MYIFRLLVFIFVVVGLFCQYHSQVIGWKDSLNSTNYYYYCYIKQKISLFPDCWNWCTFQVCSAAAVECWLFVQFNFIYCVNLCSVSTLNGKEGNSTYLDCTAWNLLVVWHVLCDKLVQHDVRTICWQQCIAYDSCCGRHCRGFDRTVIMSGYRLHGDRT